MIISLASHIFCYLRSSTTHVAKCCSMFSFLKHRDAGTRKGPGGQTLLKGTDKILIMLKSIPWNLEGQLHSCCTDHILSIASAITLDTNTSQISSIDSGTAGFIITNYRHLQNLLLYNILYT